MNLRPLESDAPLIVYIDLKSPYAYLAIAPTRALERELGLRFDWRPFVLDIPSYLGSARLGADGTVVESQRSSRQWAGVKYAYYDCRRYAQRQGISIRGTEKIWNTQLAATAMLWARSLGYDALQALIDRVFPPFWRRELDVEDEALIVTMLDNLGLDGVEFSRWAQREGYAANIAFQAEAFAAGIYGVPTYVLGGERFFGREHLPRLRWHLCGESGVAPDVANPVASIEGVDAGRPSRITVGVDDSLDCLLALPRLVPILERFDGPTDWVRIAPQPEFPDANVDAGARGALHHVFRRENALADERRYGGRAVAANAQERRTAINDALATRRIVLSDDGPDDVLQPAMPGIVVKLDEARFIGRQHLPLIAATAAPRRIVIFGNSGSGKSTRARQLSEQWGLAHLDLDTLAWEPTSPPARRALGESISEIKAFLQAHTAWVIEGCYADLLEPVLAFSDELLFMNLPVEACVANARRRPWEPHKYPSKAAQDANLPMLLAWIAEYPQRCDTFSEAEHQRLYKRYAGPKRMLIANDPDATL